jgi:adenosylhomocysteine nucleosidase
MDVLFVCALEEESARLPADADVLHLGVGKVQAAAALAGRLADGGARPDLVVNLGTAGGLHGQPTGTIVEVASVVQHDFDHVGVSAFVGRPLPGGPITLPGPDGATGRLVTGDRLITDAGERTLLAEHADVVDMEGYAVAAVCERLRIPVWLVKAVSDGADDTTVTGWHDALDHCAQRLAAWAGERGLLG